MFQTQIFNKKLVQTSIGINGSEKANAFNEAVFRD